MQDSAQAKQVNKGTFDVIDTASAQSFPASDPPAWAIGQLRPAASADASSPGEHRPSHVHGDEQGHDVAVLSPK